MSAVDEDRRAGPDAIAVGPADRRAAMGDPVGHPGAAQPTAAARRVAVPVGGRPASPAGAEPGSAERSGSRSYTAAGSAGGPSRPERAPTGVLQNRDAPAANAGGTGAVRVTSQAALSWRFKGA